MLSVEEVAKLLGVAPGTIYRRLKLGGVGLPAFVRVGVQWRTPEGEVRRFIDSQLEAMRQVEAHADVQPAAVGEGAR
ncbi:MAG: helix-turn-helix domain-containing protein [Candidatus Tectomicrobia bacterium]|uniref:Helix-turn-helix domain-containing protein n=1 Tax=Tectimicrobiota bacterium TaxID=2528274 RepID=A0A932MME8_UNCTE|nr:helix-turn-helix domain-containing protein [Candidatus Tectomicrobia bacterium]